MPQNDLPKIEQLKWGFVGFQILATCTELDLFPFIDQAKSKSRTFTEIQEYLKFPDHSVRILLFSCCANNLLIRNTDSSYSNSKAIPQGIEYEGLKLQAEFAKKIIYPAFTYLTESLKTGRNAGLKTLVGEGETLYERLSLYPELEALFQKRRTQKAEANQLPFLAKVLGDHGKNITHLLDVGGGMADTLIFLCGQYPLLKATVFDLPTVCAKAKMNIQDKGFSGRIEVISGDMFTDAYPSHIDGILYAALLTIFSEDKILRLLHKAYEALRPGGKLLIHTITSNAEETMPLSAASMSLYFSVLASGQGMAYPVTDYQRWLTKTGFTKIEVINESVRPFVAVIVATKN
ncbi:methyltransferase [Deltaproteobacteria bacterium TL4]